jgi:hypothetical protein
MGLISLWLYKENTSYGIKKNVFTLHIPPPLNSTQLLLRCSNLFKPKKKSFGCPANKKSQTFTISPTYPLHQNEWFYRLITFSGIRF